MSCQDKLISDLDSILPNFGDVSIKNVDFQPKTGVFGQILVDEVTFSGIKCARKAIWLNVRFKSRGVGIECLKLNQTKSSRRITHITLNFHQNFAMY